MRLNNIRNLFFALLLVLIVYSCIRSDNNQWPDEAFLSAWNLSSSQMDLLYNNDLIVDSSKPKGVGDFTEFNQMISHRRTYLKSIKEKYKSVEVARMKFFESFDSQHGTYSIDYKINSDTLVHRIYFDPDDKRSPIYSSSKATLSFDDLCGDFSNNQIYAGEISIFSEIKLKDGEYTLYNQCFPH